MTTIDAFLWLNVLLAFGWTIKTLSFAINRNVRSLMWLCGIGLAAVPAFHIMLAAYFGSLKQPIIWTFWNASFVVSTVILAFGISLIVAAVNRDDVGQANSIISSKEDK